VNRIQATRIQNLPSIDFARSYLTPCKAFMFRLAIRKTT
jgi:hypothetical protein